MGKIDSIENILVCPDCIRKKKEYILEKDKSGKIFCPNCKRYFYSEDGFIDLLPSKPSLGLKKAHPLFRKFYLDQFKIPPEKKYRRPKAWGIYEDLPSGYKVFLDEEKRLIESYYPINPYRRKFFCDISASNGFFAFSACDFFETVIFCDLSLENIQWARAQANARGIKNVVFVRCDYFSFPFVSNSLDFILSTDTFIYYGKKKDLQAIKSIYGKVSIGGVFSFDFHNRKFYAPAKRIYEYNPEDIKEMEGLFYNLKVFRMGRVPTILTPNKFLFHFFSRIFFFMPPIRYVCFLVKGSGAYMGDYDSIRRWSSYFYQIKLSLSFRPRNILVIGPGNGVVPDYFRKLGISVKTLDIDENLKPDYCYSISDPILYKKIKSRFDVVLCCQVLEHLKFSKFLVSLKNIYYLSKGYAILSLPNRGIGLSLLINLPKNFIFSLVVNFLIIFRDRDIGEHQWEIDRSFYNLGKIRYFINKAGFSIDKSFLVPHNPYHRFFVLRKKG